MLGVIREKIEMTKENKKMSFNATWSMAVGGMVGGGIFSVLGVIISIAGQWAWLSFVLAGLIALISAHSYSQLSLKYRKSGGAFTFLNEINHQGIIDTLEKGNIKYLLNGQLPQSEVYKLMETHEIFCVPSHKEAFGVANLEAIAHGCKIVSTNVGGIPEAMGSLNGVILVNPSKPVELLNAIEKSFNYNIEEYKNQIMTHLNEFSEKKVLNNFKKILNKINETNNTRP